jgi:hypothetical protein
MDAIDEILTTQSLDNVHLDPAIRAALTLAKKTLNKYYNLTDDSEVFRIAMSPCSNFKPYSDTTELMALSSS